MNKNKDSFFRKKRTFILFVFSFFGTLQLSSAVAQCVTSTQCCLANGDMSTWTCHGGTGGGSFLPYTPAISYPTGCVPNWTSTHGTPEHRTAAFYPFPFASMGSVHDGTSVIISEGIRADFQFKVGKTYDISFKIKVDHPTQQNSYNSDAVTYVRAMNNGPTVNIIGNNVYHNMPALPSEQQLITTVASSDYPYWVEEWETVTLQYTPSGNPTNNEFTQLWIYHLADNNQSSYASIADVQISLAEPVPSFHMQSTNDPAGTPKTIFGECNQFFVNALASFNECKFYLDVWESPAGAGTYTYLAKYGATGWTPTPAGVVDVTTAFGINFTANKDYRIKLAVQNDCYVWVETTLDFSVVAGASDPNPVCHIEANAPGKVVGNGAVKECGDMFLVETFEAANGYNYDKWYLAVRKRGLGSSLPWVWVTHNTAGQGNGWTLGTLPARLDLNALFNPQGVTFSGGVEYEFTLALSNPCNGWVATTTVMRVVPCPGMLMENGAGTTEFSSLRTRNSNENEIVAFPNPFNDHVDVLLSDNGQGSHKITLFDINGRKVYETETVDRASVKIDTKDLPTGMYILLVDDEAEKKLIKY